MNRINVNPTEDNDVEIEFRRSGEWYAASVIEESGVSVYPEENSDLKVGETMTVEAMSMAVWKVIYGEKSID